MRTTILRFTFRAAVLGVAAVLFTAATRGDDAEGRKSSKLSIEKAFETYLVNHKDGTAVFVEVPNGAKVSVEGRDAPLVVGNFSGAYFEAQNSDKLYFANVRVVYTGAGKNIEEKKRARMFAGKISWLDYTDIAAPDKKRRTVEFWNEAHNIVNDTSVLVPKIKTSADVSEAFAHVASELDALPVRGVDEDAVGAVADLSAVYTKAIKVNEANNIAGIVLESRLRRNRGDSLGILRETIDQNRTVLETFSDAVAKMKKTGRVLSARYEVELTVP